MFRISDLIDNTQDKDGDGYTNLKEYLNGTDPTVFVDLSKYGIDGCRPNLSLNGEKATWGQSDWDLYVADIDLMLSVPRVADIHGVVKCRKGYHVSHTDLSPDGRCIAFGYGPALNYSVGLKAPN